MCAWSSHWKTAEFLMNPNLCLFFSQFKGCRDVNIFLDFQDKKTQQPNQDMCCELAAEITSDFCLLKLCIFAINFPSANRCGWFQTIDI